jgi:hypothetical protein
MFERERGLVGRTIGMCELTNRTRGAVRLHQITHPVIPESIARTIIIEVLCDTSA